MTMSQPPDNALDAPHGDEQRRWLSAATDGDAQSIDKACRAWRDDAELRATWHTYHLIGDVLRSDALASAPSRDSAFMQSLRQKLAAEPRVLAPMPAPRAGRSAVSWLMPAAVAAGFVLVAGVLVVTRLSAPAAIQPAETLAAAPTQDALTRVSRGGAVPQAGLSSNSALIRDARLDEYLRAHYAARGAMAVPGSALRRVETELSPDAQR